MNHTSKPLRVAARRFGSPQLVVAVALLVGAPSSVDCAAHGPHADVVPCATCHTAGAAVTEVDAGSLTATQPALCAGCHLNATHASHPAAFTPLRPLPAKFPLDRDGQLNCTSCHEVHAGRAMPWPTRSPLRQLCVECHRQGFFDRMADGGTSLLTSGHFAVGQDPSVVALDPFSRQCLTCHMEHGSLASAVLLDSTPVARTGGHPIGGSYVQAATYGGYRPRASLPPQILLPGGRVACVSCHEGYSARHGALLVSNARSGLCNHCHSL